jgi:dephospho-CoA kinase
MKKIGVCGSIGSGKSYICNLFAELGVPIYNTDINTKKILYNPLILVQVREYFGDEIFNGDELDRKKLGDIIFKDEEKMQWLQQLLYPYLGNDLEEWCSKQDFNYVIIESAIFYETGFDE